MTTNQLFRGLSIWLMGAIFYFYEFLLQVSPGVMVADVSAKFHVSAGEIALLATFYFIAYAAMQIPAGVLYDRFGPRRLLTVACAFCAFGTLIFANTSSFSILLLARFLTGLGSAFAFLGTMVLAANWFPANRFALLSGALVTLGMLGAMFGEKPLAIMISQFGWKQTLDYLTLAGLVISALLWLVVRDRPAHLQVNDKRYVTFKSVIKGMVSVIRSFQSWVVALYGFLCYSITATLGAMWGVAFLRTAYGFTNQQAAGYISMIFIGWIVGSPLFGLMSDLSARRKPPLYISAIFCLLLISVFIYLPLSHVLLAICITLFGFFASAFLPSFSLIRELHPADRSGSALGFMNCLNSLGGALTPFLIGLILDLVKPGVAESPTTRLTASDYHIAFAILPISLIIALALIPFLKETFGRMKQS